MARGKHLSVCMVALALLAGAQCRMLLSGITGAAGVNSGQKLPSKLLMSYYETWKYTKGELGSVAPYVGVVALAFMKPDTAYVSGSMSLSDLQFSGVDGPTIKAEIQKLQKQGQKVIVSVGGDPTSGGNWDKLNPQSIANFCNDFGLDGVDLDFETTPTGCPGACSTDVSYTNAIVKMRAFLAPHLLITTAPASVGAFGSGSFQNAPGTAGSSYTGSAIQPLKQAGADVDIVAFQAYNAGTAFDPEQGFAAYKQAFNGKILIGLTPENGQRSAADVTKFASWELGQGGGGIMLYALHDKGINALAQAACNALSLSGCSTPVLPGAN